MNERRVITKYPNRRLYDTTESRYITLDDVRRLVNEGIEVAVLAKTTGDDITRHILLQIVTEQQQSGGHALSRDVLTNIIRISDGRRQNELGHFLEDSVKAFVSDQAASG